MSAKCHELHVQPNANELHTYDQLSLGTFVQVLSISRMGTIAYYYKNAKTYNYLILLFEFTLQQIHSPIQCGNGCPHGIQGILHLRLRWHGDGKYPSQQQCTKLRPQDEASTRLPTTCEKSCVGLLDSLQRVGDIYTRNRCEQDGNRNTQMLELNQNQTRMDTHASSSV